MEIINFFNDLLNLILEPIHTILQNYELENKIISIGFGNVKWFELTIVELVDLFIILIIVFGFWKIIYNFFKWLFSGFVKGWNR
ncbi:MAG TPA: hypothetical protein VIK77_12445 [Tissierellaceae bacterium]